MGAIVHFNAGAIALKRLDSNGKVSYPVTLRSSIVKVKSSRRPMSGRLQISGLSNSGFAEEKARLASEIDRVFDERRLVEQKDAQVAASMWHLFKRREREILESRRQLLNDHLKLLREREKALVEAEVEKAKALAEAEVEKALAMASAADEARAAEVEKALAKARAADEARAAAEARADNEAREKQELQLVLKKRGLPLDLLSGRVHK